RDISEIFEENPGSGGIYARLEEHGHEFAEYTETLWARLATKQESSALALSPGAPAIHLTRNAVTEAGRVVEVCETIMAADQFVLDYRIPATD
ncbi:UTRA domain-containing protein, partial [Streptomyces sp. NPDC000931]|uniref:UTRA domain-containing protein n=1 Tax=Streptomyces sp. NPDC000931 TaxID=3154372 RepID=UPI0033237F79